MKNYIDLKQYYNMRVIYPEGTLPPDKEIIGLHNKFYLAEDLPFGNIKKGGAEIILEQYDGYDCIVCDKQIVQIPNTVCKKIVVAGACTWGVYRECLKVVFDDGSIDYADIKFGDWACEPEFEYTAAMEAEKKELYFNVLKRCRKTDGEAYIYYSTTQFEISRKVKQLILPDNICILVFGITLEE